MSLIKHKYQIALSWIRSGQEVVADQSLVRSDESVWLLAGAFTGYAKDLSNEPYVNCRGRPCKQSVISMSHSEKADS